MAADPLGRDHSHNSIPSRLPHRRPHGEGSQPEALCHSWCWLRVSPPVRICRSHLLKCSHIDLDAANKRKITVAEVTGSNVVSVAEHVVMSILVLVRNFVPAHEQIRRDEWAVADVARDCFDLEGKVVGTVGVGRIGYRVLQRLQGFDCKELLYYDYAELPKGNISEV